MERLDYRNNFPVTRNLTYLSHAGVSPVSLRVKTAVETFLEESTEYGIVALEKWVSRADKIREKIAEFIGAQKEEIAFVRSTSHGLSLVAEGIDWQAGDNVVTASCEFPANLYPWMNLDRRGVETRLVDPKKGEIHLQDLLERVDSHTRLISLSWVQYQNGFRADLMEIGTFCRSKGIFFCVDGIQGVGALPIDLSNLPVDFLSADGHKWLLAPEGIGFLYLSKRVMDRIHPVIVGWHSVKNALDFEHIDFTLREDACKFEEGSPSMLGIFALGAAVELLSEVGIHMIWEQIHALNDRATEGLRMKKYEILSPLDEEKRSGILTFRSDHDSPSKLFRQLTEAGFVVAVRGGGIRISPHFYNTIDEIERFLEILF
jgi:selenocysteine lyase/cysteine desulfurase